MPIDGPNHDFQILGVELANVNGWLVNGTYKITDHGQIAVGYQLKNQNNAFAYVGESDPYSQSFRKKWRTIETNRRGREEQRWASCPLKR